MGTVRAMRAVHQDLAGEWISQIQLQHELRLILQLSQPGNHVFVYGQRAGRSRRYCVRFAPGKRQQSGVEDEQGFGKQVTAP